MIVNGYAADEDEVAAVVASVLDDIDRADPTLLYIQATKMQALYLAVAERLGAERAGAARHLVDDGLSYQGTADHLGLSKSRVQQMVAASREVKE